MKLHKTTAFALTLALAAGFGTRTLLAKEDEEEAKEQAALAATATVSKEVAQGTVLGLHPGSTVKESEIENENGKVVWSFELITTDKQEIEITVDATTGNVVSTEVEKEDGQHNQKGNHEDND